MQGSIRKKLRDTSLFDLIILYDVIMNKATFGEVAEKFSFSSEYIRRRYYSALGKIGGKCRLGLK